MTSNVALKTDPLQPQGFPQHSAKVATFFSIKYIIRPEHFYVVLECGQLRQKYRNYQEFIPQEQFCVISGCRDLRLFHVEEREMYVTLEKITLRELFCVIDYAKVSQSLCVA